MPEFRNENPSSLPKDEHITENEVTHVKRVTDPGQVREYFRNLSVESTRDARDIAYEIEEVCRILKKNIIWGVFGPGGELKRIADKNGKVEKLMPEDAPNFKALYLMGLREIPQNFGDTYEEVRASSIPQFEERIKDQYVLGVSFDYKDKEGIPKKRLVGTATMMRKKGTQPHIATFRTLYVDPVHRGKGIASTLMKQRIEYAYKQGVKIANMIVTASNVHVIEANKRAGWVSTLLEKNAAEIPRINGEGKKETVYFDWQHMKLDIKKYACENGLDIK